eukprot:scaffold870_cov268-Pinguiococcus_pyrenoidosus.AAC.94
MRQRRAGRLGATLLLAQICCSSKVFSLQMALSGGVNVNTARVNVCTNRWCKEKGSGATLASFIGLIPDDNVLVSGVGCLVRVSAAVKQRKEDADGSCSSALRRGSATKGRTSRSCIETALGMS